MGWLFAQLWVWLLLSFLVGSVVARVSIALLLPPDPSLPEGPPPGSGAG